MTTISFTRTEVLFIASSVMNNPVLAINTSVYHGLDILKKCKKHLSKRTDKNVIQAMIDAYVSKNKIPTVTRRKK